MASWVHQHHLWIRSQSTALTKGRFFLKIAFTPKRSMTQVAVPAVQRHIPGRYDVAIIGAGVVGLAVAREAAARGASVVVLEREDTIAAGASSGNSGLGHTGYDAPVGSLEQRLLRRSIKRHANLYRSLGLSGQHVRGCGSLIVAWDHAQLAQLGHVLQENYDAGDHDVRLISQDELRKMEPNLSRAALGAVFCPWETVVDPWLLPVAYAQNALLHGADIHVNTEVIATTWDRTRGLHKAQNYDSL